MGGGMRIMTIVTTMVLCLLLFFSAAALALDINIGDGDIRIRTGIEAPPQVEFAGPPELVPIPGRYVYFVPDINFDLFFYQRHWFRPYKKHWFRSDNYAGSWEHVRQAPSPLIDLPQDYRTIPPGYYRIPYGELRNNWERWEREKYWDRRLEDRGNGERERERQNRDVRPERERDHPEDRDVQPERERNRY
jgi:hypothetical protein